MQKLNKKQPCHTKVLKVGGDYLIQRLWLSELLQLDRNFFYNFSTQAKYKKMYQYHLHKIWISFNSFIENFQMTDMEKIELVNAFEEQLRLQKKRQVK